MAENDKTKTMSVEGGTYTAIPLQVKRSHNSIISPDKARDYQ